MSERPQVAPAVRRMPGRGGKGSQARDEGMPKLLDAQQVAELMNVDLITVIGWRRRDVLPPPIVIGRVVRWALSDLCDWIEEHREVQR